MPARGMIATPSGRALFVVIDETLYSVAPDGARTAINALQTRRGVVGMCIGLTQLVIVDGENGYVYDLISRLFTRITNEGWRGSYTVEYLDGYFTFIDPQTQTYYISAREDAFDFDATEFATANVSPDKLVGQVVTGRVLVLLGEVSGEIWQDSGGADFPFERNSGAVLEVGLLAAHSVKEMDNTAYWLGRDLIGAGMVYKMEGFRAVRISTMAVEEAIQKAITDRVDVSTAVAYTYQQGGHSYYCLQVPGLDTTWCFDAATQSWHERAELVEGEYAQHRGRFHAYAFGRHLIAGDDDIIYEYDLTANTNDGDTLVRDRITPHLAAASMDRLTFNALELDCTVGNGKAGQSEARVMLRYSNDGGYAWSDWRTATLGAVGERRARARWLRLGSARDRVWQVRCTDDTPFAITAARIEVT